MALRVKPMTPLLFATMIATKVVVERATIGEIEMMIAERDAQVEASVNLALGGTDA